MSAKYCTLIATAAGIVLITSNPIVAETPWPKSVTARYDVSFAGFDIGAFHFRSNVKGANYDATSHAKISLFFGSYKWQGSSRGRGRVAKAALRPKSYNFNYQGSKKRGRVRMTFNKAGTAKYRTIPPTRPSKKRVPLKAKHLLKVFDPISATILLTRANGRDPCRRRIPIFDGKQRFDLVMRRVGRTRIEEAKRSGQPVFGYVCSVRYVPIAGYKKNYATSYMANNADIRVVLRPVPSANILIPYRIEVPTYIGEAIITARNVDITTAARQRIALVH